MHLRTGCLILSVITSSASIAGAQSRPAPDDWDPETPRTVAMRGALDRPTILPQPSGPLLPTRSSEGNPRTPLAIVGGALAGLGGLTLFAAGITWIVAAGESAQLDSECPNHKCYEDSPGGDSYKEARDAAEATDVLVGLGFPIMGTGIVMLLFAAALGPTRRNVEPAPAIGASPRGMKFQF